ncbi:hypothetical protein ADUPG1_007327 [Aduncisulcus paluster]|uniref:Uncharacterized protein n=1 Tax=Aduncisulcus paluster TaxID=2918883 RepID=A0ABQ5KN78_9EUKA|nr:hypothetical protein ADUPG1_007327 [Aduncisulcus paluster]
MSKTYGIELKEIFERCDNSIPPFFIEGCQWLMKNGMKTEGLFRIPARNKDLQTWREKLDENPATSINSVTSPHLVAGILSYFLRELPTPLFPSWMFYRLHSAVEMDNPRRFAEVLCTLPGPHLALVRTFFPILFELSIHQKDTLMAPVAISACFLPILLTHPQGQVVLIMQAEYREQGRAILENLVSKWKEIEEHIVELIKSFEVKITMKVRKPRRPGQTEEEDVRDDFKKKKEDDIRTIERTRKAMEEALTKEEEESKLKKAHDEKESERRTQLERERSAVKREQEKTRALVVPAHSTQSSSSVCKTTSSTPKLNKTTHIMKYPFVAEGKGEISVKKDEKICVRKKLESGWWLVKKKNGKKGYVPGSHCEKIIKHF